MSLVRCFLAMPVPDELAVPVEELIDAGREKFRSLRWVIKGNLHLTLRFFGELDDESYKALLEELSVRFEKAPFLEGLSCGGIGCFKRGGALSVIWMNVTEKGRVLGYLAELAELSAVSVGLAPEKRPFRSHITLARCSGSGEGPAAYDYLKTRWSPTPYLPVDRVLLIKSDLTPSGPIYSIEREYTLTIRRGGR